jgi:hypothetical protein
MQAILRGFCCAQRVKKVLDPSKNPKKCQIICLASIQKITSQTFRISSKSVFYVPLKSYTHNFIVQFFFYT